MSTTEPDPLPTADLAAWRERSAILIGEDGCARLARARVLVAGLGGVGGHAADALIRAGVGTLALADHDCVAPSNLNRQLVALRSTLGQPKTAAMAARLRDINPDCRLDLLPCFLTAENIATLNIGTYDAVIDAIDSLGGKVALLAACLAAGVPVFSSMGAGGRLDPSAMRITDLMQTKQCPLARAVRQRLKRAGHGDGVVAVWSQEPALPARRAEPHAEGRARAINGTISYMPALFGLTLAGCAIRRLLGFVSTET